MEFSAPISLDGYTALTRIQLPQWSDYRSIFPKACKEHGLWNTFQPLNDRSPLGHRTKKRKGRSFKWSSWQQSKLLPNSLCQQNTLCNFSAALNGYDPFSDLILVLPASLPHQIWPHILFSKSFLLLEKQVGTWTGRWVECIAMLHNFFQTLVGLEGIKIMSYSGSGLKSL